MMTEATLGRRSSQLIATCGTLRPVSAATSVSMSTTSYNRSSGTGGPNRAVACSRLSAGSGWPRRIFPVSRPQPSGLQTSAPTPWSSPSGSRSCS